MKKGKVFGKRQIVMSLLVVCLAAAVWLNMRFSSLESDGNLTDSNGSSLGENQYLSDENLGVAVQTSTKTNEINNSRLERNKTREESLNKLKVIIDNAEIDNESKKQAIDKYTQLVEWSQIEASIESVVKSKGFGETLTIISEDSVTVIVVSENLSSSQTLQIQDAVTTQIKIELEKIKIITVK